MTSAPRDALDAKVNQVFAGKCVRKDLVRAVKVGANVPVFVVECLLGKSDLQQMPKEVITTIKTHCESGQFQRGAESFAGNASIAMFGKTQPWHGCH